MKKLLMASVLAALPFGAHAAHLAGGEPFADETFASAPISSGLLRSGIWDLSGGYRWADSNEDGQQDSAIISGAGRFNIPLSDNFSVQLDADGEFYLTSEWWGPDEENAAGVAMAGAHLNWRHPDVGLLGMFAAVGQGFNTDPENPEIGYMVGGEVQAYLGDLTFYGQAGFADFQVDDAPEGFVDGWFVRGVGRWFVGTDSLIEGEVSYGLTGTYIDGDDPGEIWNWGIKGKRRIHESGPYYGVLGYRGGYYDSTSEGDQLMDHVAYAGISILYGSNNLRENDRRGATLDLPMLPGRAAAVTEGLD